MGAALEIFTGRATAPGATFTKVTTDPTGAESVRNAPVDRRVWLLQAWADLQAAGTLRIRSPRLHDNVQGLRFNVPAGSLAPLLPWGYPQVLIPQDTLTIELTGSGTVGAIEQMAALVYYQDLPGVQARFIDTATLRSRMRNVFTVENTINPGTAGGFSGTEALNAEFDLFKANTDYALVGYVVSAQCVAVRWRGADTGNLGVGGPGDPALREWTKDWFALLSDKYGVPLIPVFNSANKGGILVDVAQDQTGTAVTVTSVFAELG